jgi:hypothetical protein
LVQCIAGQSEGYLFAGAMLMRVADNFGFELQVEHADPKMPLAFRAAGSQWVGPDDLAQIGGHTHVLYLIGKGGSIERAAGLAAAASGLLKSGGIAVKVETTGKAHRADAWHAIADSPSIVRLYDAFVVFVSDKNTAWSVGMKTFGLPDVILKSTLPIDEAVSTLNTFLLYVLLENPDLRSEQTFAASEEDPTYFLRQEGCKHYEKKDLFFNPHGVWRLIPAS